MVGRGPKVGREGFRKGREIIYKNSYRWVVLSKIKLIVKISFFFFHFKFSIDLKKIFDNFYMYKMKLNKVLRNETNYMLYFMHSKFCKTMNFLPKVMLLITV
jgi:hypothetical protein